MDTPEWNAYLAKFENIAPVEFPENTDKYCVIMEFRQHAHLLPVIRNFAALLAPKGWGLLVYHGSTNENFIKTGLSNWKHVKYCRVPFENITMQQYNTMFCSPEFWASMLKIGCDRALMFQADTVLLRDDLDRFFEYDYVGAPWFCAWRMYPASQVHVRVGNGGLSLRKVRTMLEITQKHPYSAPQNEDIWFSHWLLYDKYHLPSVEVASQFSVETIYHPSPCGLHQPHVDKMPSQEAFWNLFTVPRVDEILQIKLK